MSRRDMGAFDQWIEPFIFVADDAGIGKTRLVRELLRQIDAPQLHQVLHGRKRLLAERGFFAGRSTAEGRHLPESGILIVINDDRRSQCRSVQLGHQPCPLIPLSRHVYL